MKTRNPYSNTKKRKAALAFLAARGITQPRALYPQIRQPAEPTVTRYIQRLNRRLGLVQ